MWKTKVGIRKEAGWNRKQRRTGAYCTSPSKVDSGCLLKKENKLPVGHFQKGSLSFVIGRCMSLAARLSSGHRDCCILGNWLYPSSWQLNQSDSQKGGAARSPERG